MAFSSVGSLLTDSNGTASLSWTTTATLTRALNAGQLGVVLVASDNIGTSALNSNRHSLTDSVGNHWQKAREYQYSEGAVADAATVSVWYTIATVTLPTNGTLTIEFLTTGATVTRKAVTGWVYDIGADSWVMPKIGSDQSINSVDPAAQNQSQNVSAEYLWIRAIGQETNSTTFTPTTNYTAFTAATSDGGSITTSIAVKGEFRILTASDDTSNPTATSADGASIFIPLVEVPKSKVRLSKILAAGSSTTDASSYLTSSISPSQFKLVVAWVAIKHSSDPPTPTLSGAGLTWTQVATVADTTVDVRLTMFIGIGDPSSGQVTISPGATVSSCLWIIEEYDNAYFGNLAAFRQTKTGSRNTAADLTLTFDTGTEENPSSATIAAFVTYDGANNTSGRHGGNYARNSLIVAIETYSVVLSSQSRPDFDINPDYLDTGVTVQPDYGLGIAVEVRGFKLPAKPVIATQAMMGSYL
jgi:hypothetical protein